MTYTDEGETRSLVQEIANLEEACVRAPNDATLGACLAQLHVAAGDLEKAAKRAGRVLELPGIEGAPEAAALCEEVLGIVALADGVGSEAVERLSKAVHLRERLAQPEMLGVAWHNLGMAYWVNGDLDQASKSLEQAARLLPEGSPARDTVNTLRIAIASTPEWAAPEGVELGAQYHFRVGLLNELRGDYAEAAEGFQQAITGGLAHAETWRRLGMCLSELGRFSEAVAALKASIKAEPDFAAAHFDLAIVYQRLGMRWAEAREYERAIALNPTFADAYVNLMGLTMEEEQGAQEWGERAIEAGVVSDRIHYLLGKAQLAQGKVVDAYHSLQRALELAQDEELRKAYRDTLEALASKIAPSTVEQRMTALTTLDKGLRLRQRGELPAAVAALEAACQTDPHLVEAQNELGFAYLESGRVADAASLFERAVAEHPENQESNLGRSLVLLQVGPPAQAMNALESAAALGPHTAAGIRAKAELSRLRVQREYGNLPVELHDQAVEEMEAGRVQAALECAEQAVALAPGSAWLHDLLAELYMASHIPDRAIEQWQLAIEAQPLEAKYYYSKGIALLKEGRSSDVAPLLQKAVSLGEEDAAAHAALGAYYLASDEVVLAEAESRRALELDAESELARANLCECLVRLGRHEEAIGELEEVREVFPESELASRAQGWLDGIPELKAQVLALASREAGGGEVDQLCLQAAILAKAGYAQSALERFEEAATLDFAAFRPHFGMGNVHAQRGEHREAISEYMLAVSAEAAAEDLADAYYNMANSYRELEEYQNACAMYRKAIEAYPDIRDARSNLGTCLAIEDRFQEAVDVIQEELRLHPDMEQSAGLHAELAQYLAGLDRDADALFEIQKAILLGPNIAAVHKIRAGMLHDRLLWNLAQAEYDAALQIEPGDAQARAAVDTINIVEYEVPLAVYASGNPRAERSLQWHQEQAARRVGESAESSGSRLIKPRGE